MAKKTISDSFWLSGVSHARWFLASAFVEAMFSSFIFEDIKFGFCALGGGEKKIFEQKIDLSKVGSKCGSKDNIEHKPGARTNCVFTLLVAVVVASSYLRGWRQENL